MPSPRSACYPPPLWNRGAEQRERIEALQTRYTLMSSLVTVYGALGSLTGGSCTGTGWGSSVGVSGASSAGSRSRGSEFGLSGVFLYSVMHRTVHNRYRVSAGVSFWGD